MGMEAKEISQLNVKVRSGAEVPIRNDNPNAKEALDEIRKFLFRENIKKTPKTDK